MISNSLLSSYFVKKQPFPEYFGKKVEFNFSKIRKKGSPLSSGVGKAPGPDGLKNALMLTLERHLFFARNLVAI